MITATVLKDLNGIYQGFSVQGHALFDEKGKDIVCAAVSILTINTVNSIEQLTDSDLSVQTDEGITCKFRKQPDDKAVILMDSFLLGLKGIEQEHADYFRLVIEEV
ncbi:MAG: ribosomal-processing cysteine protease Prp [Lachnospiraceae bacterium]|nr:ribosomal-processing cysteine protease Prp [Lachnospiraceae bacterium]